jgi:esterase/lipase
MKSFYLGNIYVGYDMSPKVAEERKAIIFLLGLPGSPKEYEVFRYFKSKGFDILLPRYEGTWESKGKFLERAPSVAVDELIAALKIGIALSDGNIYKSNNVFVLGASFGGGVSLTLKNSEIVKAVCALSPVISFKNVNKIETLGTYLSTQEEGNYRFTDTQWGKLISDSLYSPITDMSISPSNVLLIAGKSDDQIMYTEIQKFATDNGILNVEIEDAGHITFSRITERLQERISGFFNSKV